MRVKLDSGAKMPERVFEYDPVYYLFSRETKTLLPGDSTILNTGVHIQLPPNTVGVINSTDELNFEHDVTANQIINASYIGPIKVKLYNNSLNKCTIYEGKPVAQLSVVKLFAVSYLREVDGLEQTDRGENGFGSSGR